METPESIAKVGAAAAGSYLGGQAMRSAVGALVGGVSGYLLAAVAVYAGQKVYAAFAQRQNPLDAFEF
jgi:hypothetical protein